MPEDQLPAYVIACRKNDDDGWDQTERYLYDCNTIVHRGTRWVLIQCPNLWQAEYQGGRYASGLRGGMTTYLNRDEAMTELTALEVYG